MKIHPVREAQQGDTPHKVDVRKLYDSEEAQAVHIALQPGESLKPHITPVNVFFYVLQGTGICTIGEEKQEVAADSLVESPAGIVHCWSNEGDSLFRVLVVKAPRPTEASRIL
ncbi:MAG: cupin domain-containing protein [Synergistales bacterium]|nr:cupin domain-containing protein [Synergistales bacterium]